MKLSEPDRIRLRHMIEAAESALEFSAGREHAELYTDKMLFSRWRASSRSLGKRHRKSAPTAEH